MKIEKLNLEHLISEVLAQTATASLVEKSNEIMRLLRTDCIILSKSDIENFSKNPYGVTIDIDKILSQPALDDESYFIYGYSFGPLIPEFYFSPNNKHRFLWLLKEPLTKSIEDIKGMMANKEGHNQAEEYRLWKEIKKNNDTKNRVIRLTRLLLMSLEPENEIWQCESDETFQEVMKHVCILEVNHFPGIAIDEFWSSNDGLIEKFAKNNKSWIEKLVDFYLPTASSATNVLIGGFTLKYFFNEGFDSANHTREKIITGIEHEEVLVFNRKLIGYEVSNIPGMTINELYIDEKGTFLIDAYHPSNFGRLNKDVIKFDGERIRFIRGKMKKD